VSSRIAELSFRIFILDKYMIFYETYTSTGISSILIVFFFFNIFLFVFSHFQDDAAFEKQSALFALAVSDIVLINM
jgi:hypothetical protein